MAHVVTDIIIPAAPYNHQRQGTSACTNLFLDVLCKKAIPPISSVAQAPLRHRITPPVSPMELRSRQMRWNSAEGMRTEAAYSVSGMPRFSLLMSMSLSSNSETLS